MQTLYEDYEARRKIKVNFLQFINNFQNYYNEEHLYYFLSSITSAMANLNNNSIYHSDLRLQNIYLTQ